MSGSRAAEQQRGYEGKRIRTICGVVQGPAVADALWAAVLLGQGGPVAVTVGEGVIF